MRRPLDPLSADRDVVLLDGALGSELTRRGADLRDPLWSAKCLLEQPALIREVHRDYFTAGADIATTATYQATFQGLAARGLGPAAAAQVLRNAVGLALAARDDFWAACDAREGRSRPLVAASIGSYGAALADGSEYRGGYARSNAQLRAFHQPRLDVLADSGADLLAFETLPCLREALALVSLLEEHPAMTAWVSFSCRDAAHTCAGDDVADCAAALDGHPQIAAVGVNCSAPQLVTSVLRRMRGKTRLPLLAYPNSGEDYDAVAKDWCGPAQDAAPAAAAFAVHAAAWREAGASIIGGCCRTTPAHIRALRAQLRPA